MNRLAFGRLIASLRKEHEDEEDNPWTQEKLAQEEETRKSLQKQDADNRNRLHTLLMSDDDSWSTIFGKVSGIVKSINELEGIEVKLQKSESNRQNDLIDMEKFLESCNSEIEKIRSEAESRINDIVKKTANIRDKIDVTIDEIVKIKDNKEKENFFMSVIKKIKRL